MTDAYCLQQVCFAYKNGPTVLSLNSLHLAAGKIHVLAGPNGSGKTTLLHLLAFLLTPTRGHIRFFGREVSKKDYTNLRRRVGLLLQRPYLFNSTVLENVACGLKLRGLKKTVRKPLALDYLAQVGLAHLASHHPASLSGGERQRIALARTLALEPEVLLLDEVFNHLDHISLHDTINLIQHINQKRKVTVVLTTHNPSQGQALAHRVYSLFEGHLIATSMTNHFKGEVEKNGHYFCSGHYRFYLPEATREGRYLTIDPNQIVLSKKPLTSSMRNIFSGKVKAIADYNGMLRVEIDAGLPFHATITRESLRLLGLHPGDKVWVQFKSTAIKVF